MFWIPIIAFLLLFVFAVALALRNAAQAEVDFHQANVKVRQAQFDELERSEAQGQISKNQANSMRSEIERAYSRAERRSDDGKFTNGPKALIWVILTLCVLAAIGSYLQIGTPQFGDVPFAKRQELENPSQERAYEILLENNALAEEPKIDAETAGLIKQLEDTLEMHPDDARGWQFLARTSYSTGNFHRAYQAQQRYIELKDDAPSAEDYALLAENMILAVNGYISPEAEEALRQALTIDPKNRVGRYYAALAMIQNDEVEDGRRLLEGLLNDTSDDPQWQAEINKRLSETEPAKGPSAEDLANAAELNAQERQEMIGDMVDGLKNRLAEQGGSPAEWAQLINALRVLERHEEANAILQEARQKFPNAPEIENLE